MTKAEALERLNTIRVLAGKTALSGESAAVLSRCLLGFSKDLEPIIHAIQNEVSDDCTDHRHKVYETMGGTHIACPTCCPKGRVIPRAANV